MRALAFTAALAAPLAGCGGGGAAADSGGGGNDGGGTGNGGGSGDGNIDGNGNEVRFQSPDDETGGYVLATVAPGMGTVRATVYDDASGTELASFVADAPGAGLSFWWTSGSSQFTRVTLHDEGGGDFAYQLTPTYMQVADTFEPNDAMQAATPMPDSGRMSAFIFAGRRGDTNDPVAYDDYYQFTAEPGALSVRLDNVPPDLAARLFLFRPDGTEIARVANGMRGAPLTMDVPAAVTQTGPLVVRVSLWDEAPPLAGAGTTVPASFTQPYQLKVSQ